MVLFVCLHLFMLLWSVMIPGLHGETTEQRTFVDAIADQSGVPTYFTIKYQGVTTYVTWLGSKSLPTLQKERRLTVLKPRRGFFLGRLRYSEYDIDLILACEYDNMEAGYGGLMRINAKTLEVAWEAILPSFGVGLPLIRDKSIYVTCIGFIGKIDFVSGKYVWKNGGLFRAGEKYGAKHDADYFNSFKLPYIRGSVVVFPENKPDTMVNKRNPLLIEVDDRTGKIIRIIDASEKTS